MRQFTFFKAVVLICFAVFTFISATAQNKLNLSPSGDFVSRYIWRGADFGNSPAIQPGLELNYGGLTLGAWGSYTTNDMNFQETDLYVSYTIKELVSLTVTDYFFPNGRITENEYFHYDSDSTGHVFEASVSFNGTEKLPLSLLVATNFAGDDAHTFEDDLQYSTYIELGYSTSLNDISLDFFVGGTPNNPDSEKDESGYYGKSAGIVNIGVTAGKELKLSDSFSLPVNISVITNPQAENIFMVLGISL